jgi:uncharacterized membrane protein YvbJ
MNCPNCGLANPDNAKFCSNCGTSFANPPAQSSTQYQNQTQYRTSPTPYQAPGPYPGTAPARGGNSLAKNVAIGCLILVAILFFFGLSCTRACFYLGHSRYLHRRYY